MGTRCIQESIRRKPWCWSIFLPEKAYQYSLKSASLNPGDVSRKPTKRRLHEFWLQHGECCSLNSTAGLDYLPCPAAGLSVFTHPVQERLLYRLSISEYRNSVVLKGGTLFLAWTGQAHRAMCDLDFLDLAQPTEKLHAMVDLGLANSRLKDYFDLYSVMKHGSFSDGPLVVAARATFRPNKTRLPSGTPVGLAISGVLGTSGLGKAMDDVSEMGWRIRNSMHAF